MDIPFPTFQAPEEAASAAAVGSHTSDWLDEMAARFRSLYPAGTPRDLTQPGTGPVPASAAAAKKAATATAKANASPDTSRDTSRDASMQEGAYPDQFGMSYRDLRDAQSSANLSDANNTIMRNGNSYTGQGKNGGGGAALPYNDALQYLVGRAAAMRGAGGTLGSSLGMGNILKMMAALTPGATLQNYQIPQLGFEGRRVSLAEQTAAPQNRVNAAAADLALGGDPNSAAILKRGASGEVPNPISFPGIMSQPYSQMGGPVGPLIMPDMTPGKYAEAARRAQQSGGVGAVRP